MKKADLDLSLKDRITTIFHEHRGRYGYRRITALLRREEVVNHKKVQRIMQELNLKSLLRIKKYQSYRIPADTITKNLLKQNFSAKRPNEKWVTDVTEFKVKGKRLYLSPILDLYNQEVISYEINHSPKFQLVEQMLQKAVDQLKKGQQKQNQLILHSDQGWQYRMNLYKQLLEKHNIKQSMSRKGNCYDNAVIENFFGLLKSECFYSQKFENIEQLEAEIHQYIAYYNHERIKLKLGGLSPVEYRTQFAHLDINL